MSEVHQTSSVHRTRGLGPSYTIGFRLPLFVFKLGGSIVLHFFANFSKTVGNIANIVSPQYKSPRALRSALTVGVHKLKIWGPDPRKFASAPRRARVCYGPVLMPVGSTLGGCRMANFDKKVSRGNRDMGVLRLGGGSKICGGATWWNLTTSLFRTRGTMTNVVGTESISTSFPELWGFEFLGVRPNCEKWGMCPLTKVAFR